MDEYEQKRREIVDALLERLEGGKRVGPWLFAPAGLLLAFMVGVAVIWFFCR